MAWTRNCLTLCLGFGLVACGDDGSSGQQTDGTSDGSTPEGTADDTAGPQTSGPENCVAGAEGCSCLNDGCAGGGLYCVEDMCVLGPQIEIGDDRSVIAGLVVPHEVEVDADEFSWSQESGPPVEILGEGLSVAVMVPADTPAGEVISLRLEATRNGVTLGETWSVRIIEAEFENALPNIGDPTQLGTTEGLAFGGLGMYVVSTEGFVSLFGEDGEFVESFDVGGAPAGASFMDDSLIVANAGSGSIQRIDVLTGSVGVLFDSIGGMGLGAVNFPLVDDEDLFISTRLDQTVLYYDGDEGSASVFLDDPGLVNPNALALGPEGNTLYVGTVGHVWRVPLLDEGMAGEPFDYLDLGDDTGETYEVDGLAFDEGSNLWVGCPNAGTLFVAPYGTDGAAEVSRSFDDAPGSISGFVNLRFGRGDFDDESLYYTNLGSGTVGRLRVGLGD